MSRPYARQACKIKVQVARLLINQELKLIRCGNGYLNYQDNGDVSSKTHCAAFLECQPD